MSYSSTIVGSSCSGSGASSTLRSAAEKTANGRRASSSHGSSHRSDGQRQQLRVSGLTEIDAPGHRMHVAVAAEQRAPGATPHRARRRRRAVTKRKWLDQVRQQVGR